MLSSASYLTATSVVMFAIKLFCYCSSATAINCIAAVRKELRAANFAYSSFIGFHSESMVSDGDAVSAGLEG